MHRTHCQTAHAARVRASLATLRRSHAIAHRLAGVFERAGDALRAAAARRRARALLQAERRLADGLRALATREARLQAAKIALERRSPADPARASGERPIAPHAPIAAASRRIDGAALALSRPADPLEALREAMAERARGIAEAEQYRDARARP